MVAATIVDIRTRRIPNELTAAMAGIGVGLSAAGVSGISVWASMLGFVIGLALMPGHVLGATGAGDVKLMAAVGAIVGPALVVPRSCSRRRRSAGGGRRREAGASAHTSSPALAGWSPVRQTRMHLRSAPAASRFAHAAGHRGGRILAALVG